MGDFWENCLKSNGLNDINIRKSHYTLEQIMCHFTYFAHNSNRTRCCQLGPTLLSICIRYRQEQMAWQQKDASWRRYFNSYLVSDDCSGKTTATAAKLKQSQNKCLWETKYSFTFGTKFFLPLFVLFHSIEKLLPLAL